MNKIIPFTKVITLNERFDEIKKIALDDTLKLEEPYLVKGDLIVRGCFKTLEKEEDFNYPIPVEIAIDSKYDTSKCSINIDDFYYEIINEQNIRVKIDLVIDDLFYKEEKEKVNELVLENNRNDYDELYEDFKDDLENTSLSNNILDNQEIEVINKINNNDEKDFKNKVENLFKETNDEKEYSVYSVYTLSENDTLEQILTQYKVTKEDLIPFNDLDKLQVGSKLIIPSIDE